MSSPQVSYEDVARNVVRRVGSKNVGIDPVTIVTLITTILPMIVNCIQKKRGIQPDQVEPTVSALCGKNYTKTRQDLAKQYQVRWFKHGQKLKKDAKKSGAMFNEAKYILSDSDALELADKTLQEAHSTSSVSYRALASSALVTAAEE